MHLNRFGFLAVLASMASSSFAAETRFVSFKAYEEFSIVTTDHQTITLGKGQLSPRPRARPTNDWRLIGKSFGMKDNSRFCSSQVFDDMLKRYSDAGDLLELGLTLRSEDRHQLKGEEAKKVAAMPLCAELEAGLIELVRLVPYFEDPTAPTPPANGSDMIVNTVLSDEGHGWLVINNRLTDGQQAIIHTGTKVKEGRFVSASDLSISSSTTKQPFAIRKDLASFSKKDLGGGSYERRTCYETVYRNECTYDPETRRGRCELVPYSVEGTRRVSWTNIEYTYINEVNFVDKDNDSRVLGVLTLETKEITRDYDYGDCETAPLPDHDHGNGPWVP
jgi:hypothetical protein